MQIESLADGLRTANYKRIAGGWAAWRPPAPLAAKPFILMPTIGASSARKHARTTPQEYALWAYLCGSYAEDEDDAFHNRRFIALWAVTELGGGEVDAHGVRNACAAGRAGPPPIIARDRFVAGLAQCEDRLWRVLAMLVTLRTPPLRGLPQRLQPRQLLCVPQMCPLFLFQSQPQVERTSIFWLELFGLMRTAQRQRTIAWLLERRVLCAEARSVLALTRLYRSIAQKRAQLLHAWDLGPEFAFYLPFVRPEDLNRRVEPSQQHQQQMVVGNTLLHHAVLLDSVAEDDNVVAVIVQLLLDAGADPWTRNLRGQTPLSLLLLHHTTSHHHEENDRKRRKRSNGAQPLLLLLLKQHTQAVGAPEQRALAVAMALHPRLGADAALGRCLTPPLVRRVVWGHALAHAYPSPDDGAMSLRL